MDRTLWGATREEDASAYRDETSKATIRPAISMVLYVGTLRKNRWRNCWDKNVEVVGVAY